MIGKYTQVKHLLDISVVMHSLEWEMHVQC